MPFKFNDTGAIEVVEVNGAKLPVFINAEGKESPFDADSTVGTIGRLNGEAKTHRTRAEAAEAKLTLYAGIDDPEAARGALDTVKKIDQKKLIDAGQVDTIRNEIAKTYETKLADSDKKFQTLEQQFFGELVGGAFARSKYIADKLAIPADLAQAAFGKNFKVEDGKPVAYDQHGNKLFSQSRPGEVADPDEALEMLVNAYPNKDRILKGSGASGGGASNSGGGNNNGAKTIKRSEWDRMKPADQTAKMRDGFTVVQ